MKNILNIDEFLNENTDNNVTFDMYSGISKDAYETIWKNKNIDDKLTNVTSDFSTAYDFSYDFKTGTYDDTVIKICNIPLDAFIGYRGKRYKDDDDFKIMTKMKDSKKIDIIEKYDLFLVNLKPFINKIEIKLISDN